MKELCWQDAEYRWHGILLQSRPHSGLQEFVGYYGLIRDFIRLSEDGGYDLFVHCVTSVSSAFAKPLAWAQMSRLFHAKQNRKVMPTTHSRRTQL